MHGLEVILVTWVRLIETVNNTSHGGFCPVRKWLNRIATSGNTSQQILEQFLQSFLLVHAMKTTMDGLLGFVAPPSCSVRESL
jgi:hypothetical protein